MNAMTFSSTINGPEIYTRVSKAYARKHWREERIDICPVNLCPGGGWRPNMPICADRGEDGTLRRTFDEIVEGFVSYNCTCRETRRYAAFYAVEHQKERP